MSQFSSLKVVFHSLPFSLWCQPTQHNSVRERGHTKKQSLLFILNSIQLHIPHPLPTLTVTVPSLVVVVTVFLVDQPPPNSFFSKGSQTFCPLQSFILLFYYSCIFFMLWHISIFFYQNTIYLFNIISFSIKENINFLVFWLILKKIQLISSIRYLKLPLK